MNETLSLRHEVRQRLIADNEFPNIPQGWGVERLRFLFRESKERNGAEPVGEMLSVSEYRGVIPRDYDNEDQKRTDEELENYRVVRPGQLAVNSMWLNHLGLGVSDHLGHVSPAYSVYDISPRLDRRFVHHLMRSNYYLKIYLRYLYGIRPNSFQIKANDWASIPIIVPDLPTQRAIADFLDRETARIDLLIEKKQRLVALLGEKLNSTITEAVTRGIKPASEWVSSGEDWIGVIPSHWSVKPLRSFFAFRNEKNDPVKTNTILSLSIARGVSLYNEDDRVGGNKRKDDISAYKIAYEGDIVLNSMNVIVGAVGRSEYFGAISPAYYALYPISDRVYVPFFEKIFLNSGFQKSLLRFGKGILMKISSTGQMNTIRMKISQDDLKSVAFPVPPLEEQHEIASRLEAETSAIALVVAGTERSIELLREYRSALITSAVTGQIDVTEWGKSGATDRQLDAIQEEMEH